MKKKKLTKKEQIQFEVGSKNVFADLGFENPDEMLFKADLTAEITRIIKKKKLTQTKAAKIIGVDHFKSKNPTYTVHETSYESAKHCLLKKASK